MVLTKADLEKIGKLLTPLKKKLNKIDKKLDITIKFFDDDIVKLKGQVDRIEKHLDLPPMQPL